MSGTRANKAKITKAQHLIAKAKKDRFKGAKLTTHIESHQLLRIMDTPGVEEMVMANRAGWYRLTLEYEGTPPSKRRIELESPDEGS